MTRRIFNAGLITLFILISANVYGQTAATLKIGVVDVETIVKELPEAIETNNKIQAMSKNYQDTLLTWQKELETKFQQYQKQKAMMPQEQQQKTEEELNALNMQILKYRDEVFGMKGTLAQAQDNMLEPIRKKVKTAIEKVAKEEKMSFVFDKGSPVVLFAEDKFDITYRVLDAIKRSSEK
jgi:outer membrane protein